MRGQGLSYEHIAGRLNEDDFKTRQGKPFKAMTVYRIVQRNVGIVPDDGKRDAESKRQSARADYKEVIGYIRTLRGQGLNYEHIADRLNENGFKTRQGEPFQAMIVLGIVKRHVGVV